MTGLVEYGLLMAGLGIGGVLGWLIAKQSTSASLIRAEERLKANEEAAETNEQRIRAEVENIATRVGEENSARFLQMAQDRFTAQQKDAEHALETRKLEVATHQADQEEMARLMTLNTDMEKERVGAYEGLKRHLKDLGDKTDSFRTEQQRFQRP